MYVSDLSQVQVLGATCSTWLTYAPSSQAHSLYWSRLQAQVWRSECGKYKQTLSLIPCYNVSP
jgi:hypothetical protein